MGCAGEEKPRAEQGKKCVPAGVHAFLELCGLCSTVPEGPWPGASPQPGSWGPLL